MSTHEAHTHTHTDTHIYTPRPRIYGREVVRERYVVEGCKL